jgi:glycosyltransferase involved in cell wall biosynthesis
MDAPDRPAGVPDEQGSPEPMSRIADTKYVIVTPAFNEAACIERTIESVVAQTILPVQWIIVDDGSTDNTLEIVQEYSRRYEWIKGVRRTKVPGQTYYGSNVYAILEGLRYLEKVEYDFLGVLDADIELCPDYYEAIFRRFEQYPELGVTSGTYLEKEDGGLIEARIDRLHTPKAIQVFRRECYEKIGGYIPFRNGGEDSGTEIMARMFGWQTWSFREIQVVHARPAGTGDGRSLLRGRFRLGLSDYCVGTHPLFMLCKCVKRSLWERPYFISGFVRLIGFLYGYCSREPCQMPKAAKKFLRREQLGRLLITLRLREPGWAPR